MLHARQVSLGKPVKHRRRVLGAKRSELLEHARLQDDAAQQRVQAAAPGGLAAARATARAARPRRRARAPCAPRRGRCGQDARGGASARGQTRDARGQHIHLLLRGEPGHASVGALRSAACGSAATHPRLGLARRSRGDCARRRSVTKPHAQPFASCRTLESSLIASHASGVGRQCEHRALSTHAESARERSALTTSLETRPAESYSRQACARCPARAGIICSI